MDVESLLDVSDDQAQLSSTFAVLMPLDCDAIDEAKPASTPEMATTAGDTIRDDLPVDFFLAECSTSNFEDAIDVTHELNTGIDTLLRPVVQAVDIDDTTLDTEQTTSPTSNPSTNATGEVAAASLLNKNPYYIGTLGSCCGHYLHHGECGKDDRPKASTCCGSPSKLCPDFQAGTCTTIRFLRHERKFVHILPSCLVALSDGECFDSACDKGHDNFEIRRAKEEDRMAELAQVGKKHDESVQTLLELVRRSMESDATQREIVEGYDAANTLNRNPGKYQKTERQLKVEVKTTLHLYTKSAEVKGINGTTIPETRKEFRKMELAANLLECQERTDENTRKQLSIVQASMRPNTGDKRRAGVLDAVFGLRRKLASKYMGEDTIKGQLRDEVVEIVEQYAKFAEENQRHDFEVFEELEEERHQEVSTGVAQLRERNDRFTSEQLSALKVSMVLDATTEQIEDGAKAATKLRRKLKSIYVGENVIKGVLRDEVEKTLKQHDELKEKEVKDSVIEE